MLPLLAEFTPLSPSAQLAISSLLTVAVAVVSIWSMTRRRPPLDTHLSKFETSIESLRKSVDQLTAAQQASADHDARLRQLEAEIPVIRKTVAEVTVALPDAVGKCAAAHRADQTRVTREWFDRIEGVEKTMSKNFQMMERALGNIEGQLKGIATHRS